MEHKATAGREPLISLIYNHAARRLCLRRRPMIPKGQNVRRHTVLWHFEARMEFLVRHGVTHFDASVENMEADTLIGHREEAAAYRVELEMVHIPATDSIALAKDPQRDRDIETYHRYIENASKAGLRGLNYNFCVSRAEGAGGLGAAYRQPARSARYVL